VSRSPRESLSELEGAALGYVWEKGPCTAHAVRTSFQKSPSSFWSGSAGAIYPLLRRLEEGGLVEAREEPRGSRKRRLLTATPRGRRALRSWLAEGLDATAAAGVFDAVRTRVFFLQALPTDRRRAFARRALKELEGHLRSVERDLQEARDSGDRYRVLGALGAWHTARARIAWMREVERELNESPEGLG
jgi:DNA-binding PadR family transcriptional regulator